MGNGELDKEITISYDTGDTDTIGTIDTDGTYTIKLDNYHDGSLEDYNTGTVTYSGETVGGMTSTFAPTFGDYDAYDESPAPWPSEYDVKKMIEIYPSLKLQYLKFIEIYNLVKDDYKGRKNDDIPF